MNNDDLMERAGARWCADHNRWECSKNRSKGRGICHKPAIRGMSACNNHSGKSVAQAKAEGQVNMMVWSAEAGQGLPSMALGETVMAQLRLAVYRSDLLGEALRLQVGEEDVEGFVGPTYTTDGQGGRVETGEAIRGLAVLEQSWRDRVVKYAEAAHRMGIAEQAIALAQDQAEIVVGAFRGVLDRLGLPSAERGAAVQWFLEELDQQQPAELEAP